MFHVSCYMIYLGSDHAGFKLKEAVKKYLAAQKIKFEDLGALELDTKDDYPDFGARVAQGVAVNPKKNKGILVCGSAEGMGMVANKFKGVRAAVVYNEETAKKSREHNDANILSISGWDLSEAKAKRIVKAWLSAKFSGGRHARRLKKIEWIERQNFNKKSVFKEYTVFDAIRDNQGKGIKANDLIKILKKIS